LAAGPIAVGAAVLLELQATGFRIPEFVVSPADSSRGHEWVFRSGGNGRGMVATPRSPVSFSFLGARGAGEGDFAARW
jgi:hypothetical protein